MWWLVVVVVKWLQDLKRHICCCQYPTYLENPMYNVITNAESRRKALSSTFECGKVLEVGLRMAHLCPQSLPFSINSSNRSQRTPLLCRYFEVLLLDEDYNSHLCLPHLCFLEPRVSRRWRWFIYHIPHLNHTARAAPRSSQENDKSSGTGAGAL